MVDDDKSLVESDDFDESALTPEEQTLFARIPQMTGSSKKAAYLAYRSCGFPIAQSCILAKTTKQTVAYWRKKDKAFAKFEGSQLQRLQATLGNDVIKFEFIRNMRLLLHGDMGIITKAINDVNEITPREYELYKALRRFYTPQDLLTIEKILDPEKHKDSGPVTINLTWGSRLEIDTPSVEGEYRDLDSED